MLEALSELRPLAVAALNIPIIDSISGIVLLITSKISSCLTRSSGPGSALGLSNSDLPPVASP